jgi:acetyl esterase
MARDRGGPHLSYQVLLYPILNADMSTYSWIESTDPVLTSYAMREKWTAYVPLTFDLKNSHISPAQAESLRELPPTLIIAVKNDPLWDEDRSFARDLEAAGVSVELYGYPNTIHGVFLMSGELDAGMNSINQVASALRRSFQDPK